MREGEETSNKELIGRIEHIQEEVEELKNDLIAQGLSVSVLRDRMFGVLDDEESREKSAMGRLKKIQGELEELKRVQSNSEQRQEKYVTGAILAALGTVVGWAITRILGGG